MIRQVINNFQLRYCDDSVTLAGGLVKGKFSNAILHKELFLPMRFNWGKVAVVLSRKMEYNQTIAKEKGGCWIWEVISIF